MAELTSLYSGVAFSDPGGKTIVMSNFTYPTQSVVIRYTPVIPSFLALLPLSLNEVTTSLRMPILITISIVALSIPVLVADIAMHMLGLKSGRDNAPVKSLMKANLSWMDGNYIDVQLLGDKHCLQFLLTLFDLAAKVHEYKCAALWFGFQMVDKRGEGLATHMVTYLEANLDSGEFLGSINGAAGNCFCVAGGRKACEHGGGETRLERGDHVDRGFVERRHGRGKRSPL